VTGGSLFTVVGGRGWLFTNRGAPPEKRDSPMLMLNAGPPLAIWLEASIRNARRSPIILRTPRPTLPIPRLRL